jgi:RNA polymerase sigma factor (sigma-70 family)
MRQLLDTVLTSLRTIAVRDAAPTADAALLQAFVERGNRDALELLIRRHADAIWRTCLRATSSVHDAEDAFQATCYILATKARSIRNNQAVAAWLHRVAVRASSAARKASRSGVELTGEPAAAAPPESSEELRMLEEEVERLPDRYRLPMVLCYLDGKTNAEAAALLGVPEGTVYSRLARGRDRLRGRLVRRGVTPAIAAATIQPALPVSEGASAALLQQAVQVAVAAPSVAAGASSSATLIAKGVLQAMWWNQCRKVGIIAAAVMCLSVAGWRVTTPSAAQAPAPKAAQPPAPKPNLAELHRIRVDIAAKVYGQLEAEYMAGKTIIPTYVNEWSLKLLEAERDADPKNELAALKAHRERVLKLRDIAKPKFDVGVVGYSHYGPLEFAVAEADLWIEQARFRAEERKQAPRGEK